MFRLKLCTRPHKVDANSDLAGAPLLVPSRCVNGDVRLLSHHGRCGYSREGASTSIRAVGPGCSFATHKNNVPHPARPRGHLGVSSHELLLRPRHHRAVYLRVANVAAACVTRSSVGRHILKPERATQSTRSPTKLSMHHAAERGCRRTYSSRSLSTILTTFCSRTVLDAAREVVRRTEAMGDLREHHQVAVVVMDAEGRIGSAALRPGFVLAIRRSGTSVRGSLSQASSCTGCDPPVLNTPGPP